MPSKLIQSFADRSGKTVDEVEQIWDEVKKKAKSKFEKENGDFWAYVSKTTQFKLGLAHKKMSFKDHLQKDKK